MPRPLGSICRDGLILAGRFFLFVFLLGVLFCAFSFFLRVGFGLIRDALSFLSIRHDPLLDLEKTIMHRPAELHLLDLPLVQIPRRMSQEVINRLPRLGVEIPCDDDRPIHAQVGPVSVQSAEEEERLTGPFVGVLRVPEAEPREKARPRLVNHINAGIAERKRKLTDG